MLNGGVILCPSISHSIASEALVVQQTRTVKGLVSDELGPVVGATVIVKGTQNGVITNVNGEFTLSGVKVGDVIEVSHIGYATLSVKYNGEQRLSLQLKEDSQQLGEVVVTALGIKREKKALGYSMQEVKEPTSCRLVRLMWLTLFPEKYQVCR